MSPIIKECINQRIDYFVLHTGQHYSHKMNGIFWEQLGLSAPDYNLNIGNDSNNQKLIKMMQGIESVFEKEKPEVVLVEGDTTTVVATSLVAYNRHIALGHVEAGLRCHDNSMPEEINRIVADHCATLLFAPTEYAERNLKRDESFINIYQTGNTIADVVKQYMPEKTNSEHYLLATIHRQENVDDAKRFGEILKGLDTIRKNLNISILYPIHPRSKKMMAQFGLQTNVKIIEPVDYLKMLELEYNADLILTDSGGVQEEACILNVPCVTMRDNTERQETVDIEANIISGADSEYIYECAKVMLNKKRNWQHPYGDGNTAKRIIEIVKERYG
jgi:UDP-N-acetylglucosamine 2-epimerase (non-hydrolysing)